MSKSKVQRPSMAMSRALGDVVVRPTLQVERTANVLVVGDCSSSMQGAPIRALHEAATSIVQLLAAPAEQGAFHVAVVAYNHTASIVAPWAPASDLSVPTLTASGATCFAAAIEAAIGAHRAAPSRPGAAARPATVFLTDGRHVSPRDPLAGVSTLKGMSDVVTIGIGDDADFGFLATLASGPEFCTRSTDPRQLRGLFASVAAALSASRAMGGLTAAGADPFASRAV